MATYYGYDYFYVVISAPNFTRDASTGIATTTDRDLPGNIRTLPMFTTAIAARDEFISTSSSANSANVSLVVTNVSQPVFYSNLAGGNIWVDQDPIVYSFTYTEQYTIFGQARAPQNKTRYVLYRPTFTQEQAPPVDPDPVTIQLKRDNTISKYSVDPRDMDVLPKYAAPVQFIRAKFATTRTAVITETIQGGFMIYEEVGSLPVAPIYVYSSKRKLVAVISADDINQYKLYTF